MSGTKTTALGRFLGGSPVTPAYLARVEPLVSELAEALELYGDDELERAAARLDVTPDDERVFLNTYECPCGETWADAWSCGCDDDCPECGTTCSPSESVEETT